MTTAATRRQLVTCEAAAELFAFDIHSVERVLRYTAPRAVPNAAPWLRGVISHGSRLVPVLDLRERLSLPVPPDNVRSRIVVVTVDDGPIGVIVDAVHEVTTVEASAIEEPPPVYRGLAKEFVAGIVRRGEQLFVLLDVGRLVSSTERLAMREAVSEAVMAGGTDGR